MLPRPAKRPFSLFWFYRFTDGVSSAVYIPPLDSSLTVSSGEPGRGVLRWGTWAPPWVAAIFRFIHTIKMLIRFFHKQVMGRSLVLQAVVICRVHGRNYRPFPTLICAFFWSCAVVRFSASFRFSVVVRFSASFQFSAVLQLSAVICIARNEGTAAIVI